jgi:hypothetical protein
VKREVVPTKKYWGMKVDLENKKMKQEVRSKKYESRNFSNP